MRNLGEKQGIDLLNRAYTNMALQVLHLIQNVEDLRVQTTALLNIG